MLFRKSKRRNDVIKIGPSRHPSGRIALSIDGVLRHKRKVCEEWLCSRADALGPSGAGAGNLHRSPLSEQDYETSCDCSSPFREERADNNMPSTKVYGVLHGARSDRRTSFSRVRTTPEQTFMNSIFLQC